MTQLREQLTNNFYDSFLDLPEVVELPLDVDFEDGSGAEN